MSQIWHVLAQVGELTSIVYRGDERSCRQTVAELLGERRRTEAASGGVLYRCIPSREGLIVTGAVLSAWTVPVPAETMP